MKLVSKNRGIKIMGYISLCILSLFSEGSKKKTRLNFMLKSVHENQCNIVIILLEISRKNIKLVTHKMSLRYDNSNRKYLSYFDHLSFLKFE